jgi:formyl-CoA transferase
MGLFETRDGAINIAVLGGWDRFPAAIGDEELANDLRFSNLKGRVRHREELRAIIEPKLRERTSAEWLEVLSAADIACGPVLSVDETFADPQADHLRLTRTVRHDEDGDLDLLRHPVTLSETPTSLRTPPPTPGSETRAILGEHGYSEDEIAEFIAQGVVDREK